MMPFVCLLAPVFVVIPALANAQPAAPEWAAVLATLEHTGDFTEDV